jgi:hypothetical protein
MIKRVDIPPELDLPSDFGYTMRGWNFSSETVRDALATHRMLNPAMELGINVCPWNCDFCFTESPMNPEGRKQRLSDEMSLEQRLQLIDESATLGTKSINLVGAGEPTIDPGFWEIVERMHSLQITPIIYTEGSLKLTHESFVRRLYDLGATVVLKVNSLTNADYQDRILRGIRPKLGIPKVSYTRERKRALDLLMNIGFNDCVPTRLAFDTIICKENEEEIEGIHRFSRINNIFTLFVNYLPSGRTCDGHTTAIARERQKQIFEQLAKIDQEEFGIKHSSHYPYSGGVPCTIRGIGLFVKINGEVFDCPGESMRLGNLADNTLAELWKKVQPISAKFDGGCFPREQAWTRLRVIK